MPPPAATAALPDDGLATLLTRVAEGDRIAYRALYAAAGSKLMGVLVRMLSDRAEAEDALQEVFTRVWLRAGRFDPDRGTGQSWLIALARNHAIDRLRSRREMVRDDEVIAALPDTQPRAEAQMMAAADARRIGDCFARLETDRASAIRGAYLDGLSYQDLASRHAVPLNTMRTWLRRGLIRLRECMEE